MNFLKNKNIKKLLNAITICLIILMFFATALFIFICLQKIGIDTEFIVEFFKNNLSNIIIIVAVLFIDPKGFKNLISSKLKKKEDEVK